MMKLKLISKWFQTKDHSLLAHKRNTIRIL